MISKIKKPVSILLVFMMIVSLFAAVPMTVNAAPPGGGGEVITSKTITLYANNGTNQSYSNSNTAGLQKIGNPSGFGFTTPDNKMFSSWNTQPDGTGADYGSSFIYYFKSDLTLYAQWVTLYTVTWKNWNGDVLETDENVAQGTTPTYDGTTPTKANDDYHSYNFSGWTDGTNTYGASDALPAVTGDVTYTAKYTVFTKQFTVFVKTTTGKTITANGVSGDTTVAELKDMVVEESGIPAAEQRLIFAGKEMENEKTLADYRIQKESTIHVVGKSYTITWKNDDGTVIDTTSVAYGTVPTHDAYKADGDDTVYTFAGWTPEVVAVTGDATYTAQFTETEKPEVIKDCDNKFGDFRLYANVPFLAGWDNLNDMLTGAIGVPTYSDSNTYFPLMDTKGYSYKLYDQTGTEIPFEITDSITEPGSNFGFGDDVTVYAKTINFTRLEGTKAIYIVATAPEPAPVEIFTQHSITLGGDIGVNFYLDSAVLDTYTGTKTVKFTCDGEETTVDVPATPTADGYKVTRNVVAAQMAHTITATLYVDGELVDTDEYSVREYAEKVFANPAAYDDKGKPDELKALVQALLNYGAMAQTVFDSALNEKPALANTVVGNNGYEGVTADQIEGAINDEASDLNEVATQLGAKYYTSSLIYLSRNTLRLYFTPTTYPGEIPNAGAYGGNLSGYYYYVDHADIPAAELDNQQTFNVNGTEFTFSALDYAKAVVESTKMEPEQQNLAKALYLYNQKANAYFDAAPAPAQKILVLDGVDKDTTVEDGYTITGTLKGDYKISIADGATVTLKDVDITCLSNNNTTANFAGITPLGDATIMLEGENTVKGGYEDFPGIFVPENTTLTIDGEGSLDASSNGYGCGIGGGNAEDAGNIIINGGTIIATGGEGAAGIGVGGGAQCGDITINGGTVTAIGGEDAAAIGSGGHATCGNITIAATVTQVTATKGDYSHDSIGRGYGGTCGTVTIEDGANVTQN